MSERTLRRILTALAVALLLYSALEIVARVRRGSTAGGGGFARMLAGLDTATLNRVRMEGPADTVVLERAGERWTANGHPTDPVAVSRLFNALATSEVGAVAANNPANHERLGVAGADAWTLRFESVDGHPMEIVLGKTGTRFGTAFARLPGEDAVITLIGDLRPSVVKPLEQWRDRRVARVDTGRVVRLEVTTASGDYALQRRDDGWSLGAAAADSFTVAMMLGELADVDATGFADGERAPAGERRTLVAVAEGADTVLALEGWVGQDAFVVRRARDATLYELSAWRGDRMMPPADSVRAR